MTPRTASILLLFGLLSGLFSTAAFESLAPAGSPPPVAKARPPEQALAIASARRTLSEARAANGESEQRRLATEARDRLAQILVDPRVEDVEAWQLFAATAVIRAHREDAAVAFEALVRLVPDWLERSDLEPLIVGLDRLGASKRQTEMAQRRTEAVSLRTRVDRGDVAAMVSLGDLYADGRGVIVSLLEAERLWQLAAAASPETADAQKRRAGELVSLTLPSAKFQLAWIPPGRFMMGSPPDEADRSSDEGPRRPVRISRGFWLVTTEVTQEQWFAVMGSNPSWFHGRDGRSGGSHHPVESISWYDAVDFANRLTEAVARQHPDLGLRAAYALTGVQRNARGSITTASVRLVAGARGFRVPTEAEWEYACRAGTTTRYHFGDEIASGQAAFGDSDGSTERVASHGRNAWNLYDMHGNVWEWCWDWYEAGWYGSNAAARNQAGERVDPTGPSGGSQRVLRGGSWSCGPRNLRSADRDSNAPGIRLDCDGVRLALDSD